MSEAAACAVLAGLIAPPAARPAGRQADAESLAALIGARKWRRSRIEPETMRDIRAKVAAAIEAGAPIEFSVPFGGYKGPGQPSAPHPDWAEIFWIAHLRHYAETLAGAHRPGVVFSLSYFHGVLGAINNLPARDQDLYIAALRPLLAHFSDGRIAFRLVDLSQAFGGPAGALAAIERRYGEMRAAMAGGDIPALAMRSAGRNLVRPPGAAPAGEDEVRASALRCAAMESLEERRRFNKYSSRIQITHIRGASLSLHLGSCRTSTLQPWVGTGVLEGGEGREWRPRILNGRNARIDARLDIPHPLADIAPSLRTLALRHHEAPR